MTANALCSLSLDPLLALVCFENRARTLPIVRAAERFAVNVLASDQEHLAGVFASKLPEGEKLGGVDHRLVDGVPVIDGALAWATCDLRELIAGGDHTIAIGEVVTIGPPLMMRAVSDLTKPFGVKTVASLNSIMVDATGMCGACMVPVTIDGKMVRKHACIDGPEIDAHIIDWDKFLPRFNQFKLQEEQSKVRHGFV